MYLEAVLDGFNAVRSRPHVSRTAMFRTCSDALVPFLACNFRESCVASPDMREMLLQTISILLQSKSFVARFEASSEARAHLVSFFCTCGVLKVKLLPRKCCWPVFEVLLFVFPGVACLRPAGMLAPTWRASCCD